MSDVDETMDSRTSSVGRKRGHQDTIEIRADAEDDRSENEAQEAPRKRTRAEELPSSRSTSLRPAQPVAKSGRWNKGVRSTGAIRTTLGGGKASLLARFGGTSDPPSLATSPEPQEAFDDDTHFGMHNAVEMGGHPVDGDAVAQNSSISYGPATPQTSTQASATTPAASGNSHGHDDATTQSAKSLPTAVDDDHEVSIGQPPKKLSKKARAALLREQQQESRRLVNQSSLSPSRKTELLSLNHLKINKATFETEKEKRAEASRNSKKEAAERKANGILPPKSRDLLSPDNPSTGDVEASFEKNEIPAMENENDVESEDESGEIPDVDVRLATPQTILANMTDRELELQLKYFPTPDGAVSMPRCLACTQSDHATLDCPFMSCQTCGEGADHGVSSCPLDELCTRCRERGHGIAACPQKLARNGSEAVACGLCHKFSHKQEECDVLWRSYTIPSQNVRMIKPLPMDCYFCGGSGHVGPQCGLRPAEEKLNCSYTFTRENHLRYSNANVSNKAVGTGKDYTVPPRKPAFNIKGKANEVITIDDSDEEMDGFIHTKVDAPQQRRQIQVGNIGAGPPRYDRGMDMQSAFASDRNAPIMPAGRAVESSRYGRERSFSPPPRYNDPPQYSPLYYDDRGNGGYRTRSQQQPPLPRGPPPLLPVRGGKGGRGGRGGARGGNTSHARNPAPPPHKTNSNGGGNGGKKKQRNRRGKN